MANSLKRNIYNIFWKFAFLINRMYPVSVLSTLFPIKWPCGCVFSALDPQLSPAMQQQRAVAVISTPPPPPSKRRKRLPHKCRKCRERFSTAEALEEHNIAEHTLTGWVRLDHHAAHHQIQQHQQQIQQQQQHQHLRAAGLDTSTKLQASWFADMVRRVDAEDAAAAAARLCDGKSVYFLLCYFSFNILMRNEKLWVELNYPRPKYETSPSSGLHFNEK